MRPEGEITRGTTNPGRLRRVDRWITQAQRGVLRAQERPLIVDLGFGASPVTTVELYRGVRAVAPDAEVIGLEIDPERVAAARRRLAALRAAGDGLPGLSFGVGGFELPVRGGRCWSGRSTCCASTKRSRPGRPGPGCGPAWLPAASWWRAPATRSAAARSGSPSPACPGPTALITFSVRLASLERPSDLAERLPKALIHRNVPGEPVHQFLRDFDRAWDRAAPYSAFGPRQRWQAAVEFLSACWPVLRYPPGGGARRWRLGEATLPWAALAPPGQK